MKGTIIMKYYIMKDWAGSYNRDFLTKFSDKQEAEEYVDALLANKTFYHHEDSFNVVDEKGDILYIILIIPVKSS